MNSEINARWATALGSKPYVHAPPANALPLKSWIP
jgi:hypothetical protein